MIEIRKYRDAAGRVVFDEWMVGLRDHRARARILVRLRRLSLGLEGDWKPVGDGVRELRVPEGQGYRIYYAWSGAAVVLLLCAGTKRTQQRDIDTARQYWRHYRGD